MLVAVKATDVDGPWKLVPLTWPTADEWNIVTENDVFVRYITKLYEIADTYDKHKTNLISRFLTTGALKEFDTEDQMFEKYSLDVAMQIASD